MRSHAITIVGAMRGVQVSRWAAGSSVDGAGVPESGFTSSLVVTCSSQGTPERRMSEANIFVHSKTILIYVLVRHST